MITFDEDFGGRKISWLFVAMGGVIVGALASIMGVGGGFVTFPMFVYIFGVSTATTSRHRYSPDHLHCRSCIHSAVCHLRLCFLYPRHGHAHWFADRIQVGALTTKVVKGIHIRGFYAMSIIAGFINRASTLPKKLTELEYINMDKALTTNIEYAGNIIFWIVVAFFGFWVISKFITNIGKLREEG